MSTTEALPLSRKRLRDLGEQLANDRKLDILRYASERGQFAVTELTDDLDIPHTTAHEYCRDLQRAGLLRRVREKPAAYAPVDFEIHLSLEEIASAVEAENQTVEYATERYGDDVIDDVLDIWERVEEGELTYREASATVDMHHADFLRVASELELLAG
jgi:DNA-binding GntR family transcriptional regulator